MLIPFCVYVSSVASGLVGALVVPRGDETRGDCVVLCCDYVEPQRGSSRFRIRDAANVPERSHDRF